MSEPHVAASCDDLSRPPQNGPLNVWPEVLASNPPARHPLDQWAVFRRNLAIRVFPLIDRPLGHAKQVGQGRLRANDFGRKIDGVSFHAASIGALYIESQEHLYPPPVALPYATLMNSKLIGKWVAAARAAKGWTQDQLGFHVGVTKANVSHWETGKHEPSFWQLLKIMDLTGHALTDVRPADDWPLPRIRREQITSLPPDRLDALQAGIAGILAAFAAAPSNSVGHTEAGSSSKPQRHAA